MPPSQDLGLAMAQIIAADALSRQFKPTQSFGKILAQFETDILELEPYSGFSNYSAERCHEYVHGPGTCTNFFSRDNACEGIFVEYFHFHFVIFRGRGYGNAWIL